MPINYGEQSNFWCAVITLLTKGQKPMNPELETQIDLTKNTILVSMCQQLDNTISFICDIPLH